MSTRDLIRSARVPPTGMEGTGIDIRYCFREIGRSLRAAEEARARDQSRQTGGREQGLGCYRPGPGRIGSSAATATAAAATTASNTMAWSTAVGTKLAAPPVVTVHDLPDWLKDWLRARAAQPAQPAQGGGVAPPHPPTRARPSIPEGQQPRGVGGPVPGHGWRWRRENQHDGGNEDSARYKGRPHPVLTLQKRRIEGGDDSMSSKKRMVRRPGGGY